MNVWVILLLMVMPVTTRKKVTQSAHCPVSQQLFGPWPSRVTQFFNAGHWSGRNSRRNGGRRKFKMVSVQETNLQESRQLLLSRSCSFKGGTDHRLINEILTGTISSSKPEKRVENTTRSRVFLTNQQVSGNVFKHCKNHGT